MADFSFKFGNFTPDSGGIIEIFTSGAMQGALKEVAEPIAEKASAMARQHIHHGGFADEGNAPYKATIVPHDRTAVAFIDTNSKQGEQDLKYFHSAASFGH